MESVALRLAASHGGRWELPPALTWLPFTTFSDDWEPLPPLNWLPYAPLFLLPLLLPLSVGSAGPLRRLRQALRPFVTDEDVASLRGGSLRRGVLPGEQAREEDFGQAGVAAQRLRVSVLLLIALTEAVAWSAAAAWYHSAGHSQQVPAAAAGALTWLFILLSLHLSTPRTPPAAITAIIVLYALRPLRSLLDLVPALLHGPAGGLTKQSAGPLLDALACFVALREIVTMPVNEGGFDGQVPRAERERLAKGEPIPEREDLGESYKLCPTTPEDYISMWQNLTYSWMTPIQQLALKRPLLPTDIWRLRSINDVTLLSRNFSRLISGNSKARLLPALVRANARDIVSDAAWKISSVSLAYAAPALMRQILDALSAPRQGLAIDGSQWDPRSYALALAFASLFLTAVRYITETRSYHHARQCGLRIRITLVSALFEKALRRRDISSAVTHSSQTKEAGKPDESTPLLKQKAKAAKESDQAEKKEESKADVGKLVNMMAGDINVLLRMGCDLHQLYGAPAEVIIATIFLYQLLGWSSIAGISLLVLALPINYWLGRRNIRVQRVWRRKTDARISLVSELFSAMRYVKTAGIDTRWRDRVLDARQKELSALIRVRLSELAFTALWLTVPIGVTLLTLYLYTTVQGEVASVSTIFTAVTLLTMLQGPLTLIPVFLMAGYNALISIERLEAFLSEEEIGAFVSSLKAAPESLEPDSELESKPFGIVKAPAMFTWPGSSTDGAATPARSFKLELPELTFPPNALSVIVGEIVSGKSSLIHALLGEMTKVQGELSLPKFNSAGSSCISFASQTPWLQAGLSVRQNIVFVTKYDAARYQQVLHACALEQDMKQLADGDATRVAKGTLSGGQLMRLTVARALYAHSHTVILDDCLSAVDAAVQQHLVKYALTGPLAKGRRIILATHHFGVVAQHASFVVKLRGGRVEEVTDGKRPASEAQPDNGESSKSSAAQSDDEHQPALIDTAPQEHKAAGSAVSKPPRLLYALERRNEGAVRWSLYALYARASSAWPWVVIIAISIVYRLANTLQQVWLKVWGEASLHSAHGGSIWLPDLPPAEGHANFYIGIFSLISLALIVLVLIRSLFFYYATFRASQRLYTTLMTKLIRAPMSWFDATPTGRIIQRLGQDFSVVDMELPGSSLSMLLNIFALTSYLLVCAVIVPWFLVPSAFLLVGGPYAVRGFLAATRDMQRVESTSQSPMYQTFAATLEGIVTIRAFGAERSAVAQMRDITASVMSQWWAICTIEIWLSLRCQILGGLSVFFATLFSITGAVSPGSAGIVMMSAQLITQICYTLCGTYKNLTNNMNSVERIVEYMDVEQEAPAVTEDRQLPAAWPSSSGTISVESLRMRYRPELPEVLKGVSFDVRPHEKIGICGRSASGKTSLGQSFFRITEPCGGRIVIDGLDIAEVGLDDLRHRLTTVDQSPTLFAGTIRENLDPWGEHSDEALQNALARVRLAPSLVTDRIESEVEEDPAGFATISLDSPVAPGGGNFSAGQAQLLALARALLRNAPIIVLDEATSNTDHQTDALIQQVIRTQLKQAIVLTIAHRISTLMDYDRILVLSEGEVVEFDTPAVLLRKPGGKLREMCKAGGPEAYAELRVAAGLPASDELDEVDT